MNNTYPWHKTALNHIEQQLQAQRLPHALLFRRRHGYFDEALGWGIAKRLLCNQKSACDNCQHCRLVSENSHPNILFLDVLNDKIGIDQVRDLEQQMWQTAIFDKPKVGFIHGMDLLSIGAQNALLKTLEEPPKNAFFVLSVANISRVLPTIMSRVQRLHHVRFDSQQLISWLQQQLGDKAPTQAMMTKIIKLADNTPRFALALLASPDEVAQREQEKQRFAGFISGKTTVEHLLADLNTDNTADTLGRFCRYTEGIMRFLFEKSSQATDKTDKHGLQYARWNGVSLQSLFHLYDILKAQQRLVHTNVNMGMQLSTHLSDWQHDRRS